MGKSTKKSATKVDAAPAVASPAKTMKKGKREAEEVTEKLVAAKKQKTANGAVAQPVEAKKKVEAKVQKKIPKKEESSSSDSDESSSDSEMEEQKVDTLKKGPRDVKLPPKGASDTSEESSEEDSDSSSDEEPEPVVPPKKETVPAAKTVADDSSSDDSDSESEEDEEPKKKAAVPSAKEATPAVKNSIATAPKKESESSDESSSDESSDEDDAKPTSQPTKVSNVDVKNGVAKAKEETSDSSSEESDSDEEMTDKATQPKLVGAAAKKPSGDVTKKKEETSESSEEESSSDESDSDGEKAKAVDTKKTVSAPSSNKKPVTEDDEDSSSDSDEEDSSEEEDEQPAKTPKKKGSDVEMVDAPSAKTTGSLSEKKMPQTPSTPQTGGSKTLFVGNLPFSVEEEDVREFFKDAGEIVEVRFAMRDEKFAGYGHVEFTTEEAAQKALELNGKLILNSRAVRLDLARERGAYTPASGRNESFQKGGRSQGQTIFVRGFDNTDTEDNIRNKLEEHFGKCGEISRLSIPKDYDSGSVKGFAYIDFQDKEAFSKALELNGSEFGEDMYLTVDEAKPRGDNREGFGRGGGRRGGGRSGGRDGGGRFGGRDGGGRFGGGRSGGRSGGRRGGRTPNRPSMATAGTGKKTTFGDD